jgi:crossover junction endodeoxyribonuclease RusA
MTTATTQRTYRLNFFVAGLPAPQGSKRYVGNGISIESAKTLPTWRHDVRTTAQDVMTESDLPIMTGAVLLKLRFVMKRPVATPKTKPTPPAVKKPDLDKITRAVCDSLTKVIYHDDSQIIHIDAYKRIAEPNEPTGVHVSIATAP